MSVGSCSWSTCNASSVCRLADGSKRRLVSPSLAWLQRQVAPSSKPRGIIDTQSTNWSLTGAYLQYTAVRFSRSCSCSCASHVLACDASGEGATRADAFELFFGAVEATGCVASAAFTLLP
eukprot:5215935-Prymnesium_polylepis.1